MMTLDRFNALPRVQQRVYLCSCIVWIVMIGTLCGWATVAAMMCAPPIPLRAIPPPPST